MSEADVFSANAPHSIMKGQSQLIVVLGNSEVVKETTKSLRTLGTATRVASGLFVIHNQMHKDQSLLRTLPAISFQKARAIPSINERGEEANHRRVYAVVSYHFKNPTALQKKRVERLVRKSISVRLRPGVLLFPVLKSKDRRRLLDSDEKNQLINSRRMSEELRSLGATVSRWSRLKLTDYHDSRIHDAVARTLSRDMSSIELLAKELREHAKSTRSEMKTLKKRYSILSRRYRELKIKWSLANRIWDYDVTKSLTRTYNLVIATRRAIDVAT
ncbi:MAG: hypothetical protein ACXADS_13140 [Candidatus Thorarchaeota archaeon]